MPKNDVILPKQWHLEGIGKNQDSLRKDKERKRKLDLIIDRYANQKVFTLSKGVERDQQRSGYINHD